MYFAIGVEPTKETAWMPGWLRIASTATLSPWITLSTPSGKPASLNSSAIRTDAEGTCSEGLRMKLLPQAMAIGNIHSGTITGKLNGVMPAQTPTGWRSVWVSTWVPTFSAYSPLSRCGMPQANSTTSMPRWTEPIASGSVLPCSSVTRRASSFWFACRSCRNFCITRARRSGGVSRHSGNAAVAAFTAESTIAASANGTRFVTWPVAGLNASPWRPEGATGLPWIQSGTVSSFSSAGLFIDGLVQGRQSYPRHGSACPRETRFPRRDALLGGIRRRLSQHRRPARAGAPRVSRWQCVARALGAARALRHPRDRIWLRPEFPRHLAGVEARSIAQSPAALRIDREASVHGRRPAHAASALSGARSRSIGASCPLAAARQWRASPRIRQCGPEPLFRRCGDAARLAPRGRRGLPRRLRAGEEPRDVDPSDEARGFAAHGPGCDGGDMERGRQRARGAAGHRLRGGEARRLRRQEGNARRPQREIGA